MRTPSALAVFAHPDDDELTCFGTLARMAKHGYSVTVLELTMGRNSSQKQIDNRQLETHYAATLGGYDVIYESLQDGFLGYDAGTVSLVETYIQKLRPVIVITHFPQGMGHGHQDHDATASAVVNAARRATFVEWMLFAEPPTHNTGFQPNVFVEISPYIDLKQAAIAAHLSEESKAYMRPQIANVRAMWWALQVTPNDFNENRYYEAFVVVKGIIRLDSNALPF